MSIIVPGVVEIPAQNINNRENFAYQCRGLGKRVRTTAGKEIVDPYCYSPRCPRCCRILKINIYNSSPAALLVHCITSYFVLPYGQWIDKDTKASLNESFWRKMKRKFKGESAYITSLEMQNNLYHVNYYVLHDNKLDYSLVRKFWIDTVLRYTGKRLDEKELDVGVVASDPKVVSYVTKFYERDPEQYLPPKWLAKMVMYRSKNYQKYVGARLLEDMVNAIVGSGMSETTE